MRPGRRIRFALTIVASFLALAWHRPVAAEDECLACHSDSSLELELPDGPVSLFVDGSQLAGSVHRDLACSDCHFDKVEHPTGEVAFRDRRDLALAKSETCRRCHFENYTKTLESIHFQLIAAGDRRAPTCIDCHGAHTIAPAAPQMRISLGCQKCHGEIASLYRKSVHGRALIEEANPDVPACSDCHRAHDIEDPRQQAFRVRTPELCARCHADETKMKRYGLSTAVIATYSADFHGASARLRRNDDRPARDWTAVCTDCHGVHDISRADDSRSPVVAANLSKTCGRCHPGAAPSFSSAWMSHYEPSWQKARLVWLVKLFYRGFLPFTILGLVLHVLIHLLHAMRNRP